MSQLEKNCDKIIYAVGFVVGLLAFLGMVNVIDFRICAGAVGYCNPPHTQAER